MIERAIGAIDGVVMRGVDRGHPLFGPAGVDPRRGAGPTRQSAPLPCGLIALGQRSTQRFDTRPGSELLAFLGATLAHMMARWLLP